jgi:hypothetical protein
MPDDTKRAARIEKDIAMFYANLAKMGRIEGEANAAKVVELSEMYARDAESYLKKGDLFTSFSCISYAHGLLDAIIKLSGGGYVR